jgi:hypothetical protein
MLRRVVAFCTWLVFAHLTAIVCLAASGWKPVTPQDLKLTAADLGDADADAAILFREGTLNDGEIDGTNLKLYIRIKIFNDRGRRYGDVQLPYKVELGKITDVHARAIKADGTVIDVENKDIFDKLIVKNSSGTHRAKVFSMPGVEPGTIIEYRYRQVYPQGFRYFQLELQDELFIKELRYRINMPPLTKADVRWVTFNVEDEKRFDPVWDGAFVIAADNIKAFKREPMMPPELTVKMWGWLYYSNEYEVKPDKYWRDYAEQMHAAALNETAPTRTIRRVVETITSADRTAPEKLKRLYDYVQTEIQNIGARDPDKETINADDNFKRNPTADQTIRRRYGDPREINRLFIAMLRAAGFDARVAELVTRDENFFHKAFTDGFQFDDEVTAVVQPDGSLQFFDPGTAYCPLGSLAWDKEAVTALIYGKKDWRFAETSITPAERNREERRLLITPYTDGRVDVQIDTKVTGQKALEMQSELTGLSREEQSKRMLAATREKFPFAQINESSVKVADSRQASGAVAASYNFTLPQGAVRTGKRLFLRPALINRRNDTFLPATNRVNSLYFHYAWSENDTAVIDIPEGYEVEQLPDAISIDIGAAQYTASFHSDGRRIVYERKLLVNAITITPNQYATAKAFFDRVMEADRVLLSFKQK